MTKARARRPCYNPDMEDVQGYVQRLGKAARAASRQLAELSGEKKTAALGRVAAMIRESQPKLIEANQQDIAAAQTAGLAGNLVERLKLNEKRVNSMAEAVEQIARQV